MIFHELHRINQTFILDPFTYTPVDLAPREEVASPDKLLAVVRTDNEHWDSIIGPSGDALRSVWIPWSVSYTDRISGMCFYVIATDPELFHSIRELAAGSVTVDAEALLAWLCRWQANYFLITTPLLMYHGESSDIIYSVNHGIHTAATPLLYTSQTLDQMLHHNAYTVGNALTLFLAMERAGRWRASVVQEALQRFHDLGGGHGLGAAVSPIPNEFIMFYAQHTIYHISNYPLLYACMGKRPCSPGIRNLLLDIDGFNDFPYPYIQFVSDDQSHAIITSPASAMMPYLRSPDEDENDPLPYYADEPSHLRAYLFGNINLAAGDEEDDDDDEDDEDDEDSDDDADAVNPGPHLPMPPVAPSTPAFLLPPNSPTAANTATGTATAPVPAPRTDFYIGDISGIMMSVLTQPSAWDWWNRQHVAATFIFRYATSGFATNIEAMDYVFRRLFHLYETNYAERRGRLRAIMKKWMTTLDPDGRDFNSWIGKYAFGRHLRHALHVAGVSAATPFGHPRTSLWNPPIPTLFMQDALSYYRAAFSLYTPRVILVHSNYSGILRAIYGADILNQTEDLIPNLSRPRYLFRITVTLYKTFKRYAADTPEAGFRRIIDGRVTKRLTLINKAFQLPENTPFGLVTDMMTEYYKKNRIELVL